jgi:hypothetical protein
MTVTIEIEAPSAPTASRLTARSSIAVADVELARHTLATLHEPQPLEDAGGRVFARLRRFVVRDAEELSSRS